MKIAIIQPVVPTYREEFFKELQKYVDMDIYVYKDPNIVQREHTQTSSFFVKNLPNKSFKGFLLYSPSILLSKKYDLIVLMMQFNHITTLLLLITKFIHRKKIILWGHGISVKRYLSEEKHPDWKLKWMLSMANGGWLYMDKEYEQWHGIFPTKPLAALNNTVSDSVHISKIDVYSTKDLLKRKYNIQQKRIAIFCARFNTTYRRTDLLLNIIEHSDDHKLGFIIIGDGEFKPDFRNYKNVYDFGTVYDKSIKQDLFSIADIYLQPGWVGLSIVEAMAYAKPIFTFRRTPDIYQCVEYSYISDNENGMIFDNVEKCVDALQNMPDDKIEQMGRKARELVQNHLTPSNMASKAFHIIKEVLG